MFGCTIQLQLQALYDLCLHFTVNILQIYMYTVFHLYLIWSQERIKELVIFFNLGGTDRGQRTPTDATDTYPCTTTETCDHRFCRIRDVVHKAVQMFSSPVLQKACDIRLAAK